MNKLNFNIQRNWRIIFDLNDWGDEGTRSIVKPNPFAKKVNALAAQSLRHQGFNVKVYN